MPSITIPLQDKEKTIRNFTFVSDVVFGEVQRTLISNRQKEIDGIKFGGVGDITRRPKHEAVWTTLIFDKVVGIYDEAAREARERGRPVDIESARLHDLVSSRFRNFIARHRGEADEKHSVGLYLNVKAVDLISNFFEDVDVIAEFKFFVYWTVESGKLSLNVSNLVEDDLFVMNNHILALLAGMGGVALPQNTARNLLEIPIEIELNSALDVARATAAKEAGLAAADAIAVTDVFIDGEGNLFAILTW